jgi:hypothetical protein
MAGEMRSNAWLACALLAGAMLVSCGGPDPSRTTEASTTASATGLPLRSAAASPAAATAVGEPSPPVSDACPVTTPNASTPPGEEASPQNHGEHGIWTVLWPAGTVVVPAANVDDRGVLWMKFPWWRGRGVNGLLAVSGREASTGAAIETDVPVYGATGFQASGLGFPGPGCYEISARAGDARLTIVTRVRLAAG